jgi:hypothetical protein
LSSNPQDNIIAYPDCISTSTYGITQFWAEEYWAWQKIQELKLLYPQIDLTGLINPIFEIHLPNLTKINPHMNITETRDYKDIPVDSWEIEYKRLNIATSHAPSRFKAQNYMKKFTNDFRIITLDAHLDIGKSNLIHAAWLTQDLAKKTALIGGWSETSEDVCFAQNLFPFFSYQISDLFEKKLFKNWIEGKKVYITIDLDFFPHKDNYLGLSSYWHRNLFIGHAMNIKQRIELLEDIEVGLNRELAGVGLHIFDDISSFKRQKSASIQQQICQINKLLQDLIEFLQETSTSLLSLDLVEYSPICDWQNLTIERLEENFHFLNNLINAINE